MSKNKFKLNSGVRFVIFCCLKDGDSVRSMCKKIGVSTNTYYSWLKAGKKLAREKFNKKKLEYKDLEKIKLFEMVNKFEN